MLFWHFNTKILTKRLNIFGVGLVYLIPGMKLYDILWRNAFYSTTSYRTFPGKMLGSVLTSEDVVSLRIELERVDVNLVAEVIA